MARKPDCTGVGDRRSRALTSCPWPALTLIKDEPVGTYPASDRSTRLNLNDSGEAPITDLGPTSISETGTNQLLSKTADVTSHFSTEGEACVDTVAGI